MGTYRRRGPRHRGVGVDAHDEPVPLAPRGLEVANVPGVEEVMQLFKAAILPLIYAAIFWLAYVATIGMRMRRLT